MAQISLINGSGKTIKVGDPVKLHATKKNSFDYANLGEIVIGTATQQTVNGARCLINLLGTVMWNDIIGRPEGPSSTSSNYTPAEKAKLAGLPKITIAPYPPTNPEFNEIWITNSN